MSIYTGGTAGCTATNKRGIRCGNAPVRHGLCPYHQPEERVCRLLAKLDRNQKQRAAIVAELGAASNGKYGA